MIYSGCRSSDVRIAFDLKWYAVLKLLKHKVGQLLDHSAAVIAGDFLPAAKGRGRCPWITCHKHNVEWRPLQCRCAAAIGAAWLAERPDRQESWRKKAVFA